MSRQPNPASEHGADEVRLVYIEYKTESNEGGADLMEHPSNKLLGKTRDEKLIEASVDTSDDVNQGIVCAYLGIDGHWHLDHYLSEDEISSFEI